MKYLLYLIAISSLFISTANAAESFGCFALDLNDASKPDPVCVKTSYEEYTPLDVISKGYWDALVDHTGVAVWDGAKSQGEALGSQLALQVGGALAQKLGAPPFVLNALGIGGGDISNSRLVEEVERLLQAQTEVLIDEMNEQREQTVEDIKQVLANNCTIETKLSYQGILSGISIWSQWGLENKMDDVNRGQLLDRLYDLSEIEYKFAYNDKETAFCYWGKHVEYFAWAMRIYGLDINTWTAYQNLLVEDPVLLKRDLTVNLEEIQGRVEDTIAALERTQTQDMLEFDVDATGNKANAWWDDVVLDTGDYVHLDAEDHYWTFNYSDIDSVIADTLRASVSFEENNYGAEQYIVNTWGTYSINGHEYTLKKYGLSAYTASMRPDCDAPIAAGCLEYEGASASMIVAEHFATSNNLFYMSDNTASNPAVDFDAFAKDIFQYHMDLEYTQRLQNAYAPYQQFLDDVWAMVELERPRNKMDNEYDRISGLELLDTDGLSIKTELDIGTDPEKDDTDGDGFGDGFEHANRVQGFDPIVAHNFYSDEDGDGASDLDEYAAGTDMFDYEDNPAARAERQRLAAIMVPIIGLILN
ncbi:MAG: hypothetical protein V7785_08085 [Bermanella sp.]